MKGKAQLILGVIAPNPCKKITKEITLQIDYFNCFDYNGFNFFLKIHYNHNNWNNRLKDDFVVIITAKIID
jgi:hypothetical protein